MIEKLKQFYSYFYRKVFSQRPSFSDRDELIFVNFEKYISKLYGDSVSDEWLFNYLLFQWDKFSTADTKMKVQVHWIFGKKALQYWKQRSKEHHEYFNNQFKESYNIRKGDLVKLKTDLSTNYRSNERNRFKDPHRRVLHCNELQLFDPSTSDCKFCKMRQCCEG